MSTTHIVVSGVSGAGKTTIAELVAASLGAVCGDADDLHPHANIDKMTAGHPLTDADRAPWLDLVVAWFNEHAAAGQSTVLACSALKRIYRDHIQHADVAVTFVALDVDADELHHRLEKRTGHFMSAKMLDSQLQTWEPLEPDEHGVTVNGSGDEDDIVARVLAAIAGLAN